MAILGVLLGLNIATVAVLVWFVKTEYPVIMKALEAVENRVTVVEKRKAVIAEAVASQPKPAGVGAVRMRTWNEDIEAAE